VIPPVSFPADDDGLMAAAAVTTEWVASFRRHTSGLLCVGEDRGRRDDLGLGLMGATTTDPRPTGAGHLLFDEARAAVDEIADFVGAEVAV
jgi:3,4-dihydroxy-2-butanone 4-phosphate synthase